MRSSYPRDRNSHTIVSVGESSKHGGASIVNQRNKGKRHNPYRTHTNTHEIKINILEPEERGPKVKIRMFRRGTGPIAEFESRLGGSEQNQLQVRDILEKHGFKSIYAFSADFGGACALIRFNPEDGRSLPRYRDGDVIDVDGIPRDPIVKPETVIFVVVAAVIILASILLWRSTSEWRKKYLSITASPPWIYSFAILALNYLRKRRKRF